MADKGETSPSELNWRSLSKETDIKKRSQWERLKMVRVDGIEPTQPAWKAGVLPLNYTRKWIEGTNIGRFG